MHLSTGTPTREAANRYTSGSGGAKGRQKGTSAGERTMTEDRKYAILFAATLLCAPKLIELDRSRPGPAKVAVVEYAISQAAFILEWIERKWPE